MHQFRTNWLKDNRDDSSRVHFITTFMIQIFRGGKLEALSDFELVRKINDGYVDAFAVLVKRYERPLQLLSIRYVRDSQIAEDIVQESFLKAYEKLSTFQFRSAFKSWLYRIVINTAKNVLRSSRATVDINDVQIKIENQCENHLIDKQLMTQVVAAIEVLPEKQQQALKLRVFDDLSFKAVAEEMDCPYDTAKANYRHGLIKLREKMVITW